MSLIDFCCKFQAFKNIFCLKILRFSTADHTTSLSVSQNQTLTTTELVDIAQGGHNFGLCNISVNCIAN